MRAFKGNTTPTGQVPLFVGTSYDTVQKVYERLDDIVKMGTILEQTTDFLFFHYDVPWESLNQTTFTGLDKYDRPLKIIEDPMVYLNGVRVPLAELTVLGDGTVLEFNNPVAPGDQVHIAAFGFNADGTIYFHPLLAIDSLLEILADTESLRDQMVGHVGTVTSLVSSHQTELDAYDLVLQDTLAAVTGQVTEVGDIYTRAQAGWINAGFEQGSDAVKGIPIGWAGDASNDTALHTLAGRSPNVSAASVYKSTRSFGNVTQVLGPWWYISKLFQVSGGDRLVANYRYWSHGFLPTPGLQALEPGFLDTNDTLVEFVSYDADGVVLETTQTLSLSHRIWDETGAKPLDQTWMNTNNTPVLLHANAAFAEVRLIFANGTGALDDLPDFQTNSVGNHSGLVDDVEFYSANGYSLVEVSPSILGSVIAAKTAIVNSQASSGYATAASDAATAATQQAVLAATSASAAGVIETQVATALSSAQSAASAASESHVLAAEANLEAGERARGNYIGKASFEDGTFGGWVANTATLAISNVPEAHPLLRTKALHQIGGVTYYAPLNGGGWFEEDLQGRDFSLEAWVYNSTDSAVEIGIEAVLTSTGVATYFFHEMEGGMTSDWVKLDERLAQIAVQTTKWRPVLRVLGLGSCYWSDLVFRDVSGLVVVEGVATAVAIGLTDVEAYVTEAEEFALATSLDALSADTSKADAAVSAGLAATSATDAENAAASAESFLSLSAQISAGGLSIIDDVFLGSDSWASFGAGGLAVSSANEKHLTGKTWLLTTVGTGEIGISISDAHFTGAKNPNALVLEVEFELISGDLDGLTVEVLWSNSGAIGPSVILPLGSDPNVSATLGVLQKARVILKRPVGVTPANFTGHSLKISANGLAPLSAKAVKLHLVTVVAASAEEQGLGLIQAKLDAEYLTAVDTTSAIAAIETALSADMGALEATVTSVTVAQADTDQAVASVKQTLSATANAGTGYFYDTFDGDMSMWEVLLGTGEVAAISASIGVGPKILRLGNNSGNDTVWIAHKHLIPFDPAKLYKMTVRGKQSFGTGGTYAGFLGVAADGVTLVNSAGANSISSQHYHALANAVLTTTLTDYSGYTQGRATPGIATPGSAANPSEMHTSVAFLRPMIIANYNGVAGQLDLVSVRVDDGTIADLPGSVEIQASVLSGLTDQSVTAKYMLRQKAGAATGTFEMVTTNNPDGIASTAAFWVDNFSVNASNVKFSAGSPFTDFDMIDDNYWASTSAASWAFFDTSADDLGQRYINVNASAAIEYVVSDWFNVDPSTQYLVSGFAWLSTATAGSGTSTVSLQRASVDAAGVKTALGSTTIKSVTDAIYNAVSGRGEVTITTESTARMARFVIGRSAGGTAAARAGGFRLQKKVGASILVDGEVITTAAQIRNAVVGTAHIVDLSVTTLKIGDNAVALEYENLIAGTQILSPAAGTTVGGGVLGNELTISDASAANLPIWITFSCEVEFSKEAIGYMTASVALDIGGTTPTAMNLRVYIPVANGVIKIPISFTRRIAGKPVPYDIFETYYASSVSTGDGTVKFRNRSIAVRIKKD